jgi:hypothetical protein
MKYLLTLAIFVVTMAGCTSSSYLRAMATLTADKWLPIGGEVTVAMTINTQKMLNQEAFLDEGRSLNPGRKFYAVFCYPCSPGYHVYNDNSRLGGAPDPNFYIDPKTKPFPDYLEPLNTTLTAERVVLPIETSFDPKSTTLSAQIRVKRTGENPNVDDRGYACFGGGFIHTDINATPQDVVTGKADAFVIAMGSTCLPETGPLLP